ncbi:MAG: hypothetical protein OTJ45_09530, partial [Alphaproteobacteria bacterium]|nr:hypothetical protein [Alphaproteobacteria bacterium]
TPLTSLNQARKVHALRAFSCLLAAALVTPSRRPSRDQDADAEPNGDPEARKQAHVVSFASAKSRPNTKPQDNPSDHRMGAATGQQLLIERFRL